MGYNIKPMQNERWWTPDKSSINCKLAAFVCTSSSVNSFMRIVLSNSSSRWGGVHTVTEMLARRLSARGHDVRVFGFPGGMLEERLGGVIPFEPVLGGMDFNPRVLLKVGLALRRHRPDVVLTMMKKDTTMTALIASVMGIPVIVRHANDRPLRDAHYIKALYGRVPTLHVANAEATRRTLLQSAPWLSADAIKVIYNGVDPVPFQSAERIDTKVPADGVAIGYVGSFERRKGVLELARAWQEISAKVPNAHLLLFGKGAMEQEMRSILKDAPRVSWPGYQKNVAAALRSLDMLVLPSHVEGAPNIVLEAMAAGVPVVATAVSGTPELMSDGIEGTLIPDRNHNALVNAISSLAMDGALRSKMSAAGPRRVAERFTISAMIASYEEAFSKAIAVSRSKVRRRGAKAFLSRSTTGMCISALLTRLIVTNGTNFWPNVSQSVQKLQELIDTLATAT